MAAEARAQVRFDPELVSSYRLLGYENRALDDEEFEDLGVDAGELGAGHHATALYEVRLADEVEPGARSGPPRCAGPTPATAAPTRPPAGVRAASESSPGPAFELAGAVADTALLIKGGGVRRRGLDELELRVSDLAARDVDGAEELLDGDQGGACGVLSRPYQPLSMPLPLVQLALHSLWFCKPLKGR